MTKVPRQITLVFDGDCGVCTRSVRWIKRFDRKRRITAVPYQMPGVPTSAGLAVEEYERAAWAVTPEGRRYRGAGAVNLAVAVALGTNLPYAFYRLPLVKTGSPRTATGFPGTSRTARSTRASVLERPVLRSGGPSSDSPRSALAALLEHEEGGKRRTLTRTGCGHAPEEIHPLRSVVHSGFSGT
jgi:predicted DCC family thiol-disulfide oxidoreductase YuxK